MSGYKMFSPSLLKRYPENQKGVGLIELMVSITLGLLILAGVVQMFASSSATSIAADGASRIQENLRYAMTRIANDVAQAGNLGCYSSSYASLTGDVPNNLLSQTGGVGGLNDYSTFISGLDGGNVAGVEAPDELILKYVDQSAAIPVTFSSTSTINIDTSDPDYAGLQPFETIFMANCERSAIAMLPAALPAPGTGFSRITLDTIAAPSEPGNQVNPDQLNRSEEHLMSDGKSLAFAYAGSSGAYAYSIRTMNDTGATPCSTASLGTCALYRRVNLGVRNLTFVNANGLPGNFDQIDRVRVTLSLNSIDNTPDGLITKTVARVFGVRTVRQQ